MKITATLLLLASMSLQAWAAPKEIKRDTQTKVTPLPRHHQTAYHPDFSFYDVQLSLSDDSDGDGYYTRFTLSVDADTQFERHNVYMRVYLSQDAGPWQYIYTTDTFTLYDDSSDDEITRSTQLDSGFSADHYDLLIELYATDSDSPVARYSSDQDNSLYALPLESQEFDGHRGQVHHIQGGSMGILLLLLCFPLIYKRYSE